MDLYGVLDAKGLMEAAFASAWSLGPEGEGGRNRAGPGRQALPTLQAERRYDAILLQA